MNHKTLLISQASLRTNTPCFIIHFVAGLAIAQKSILELEEVTLQYF